MTSFNLVLLVITGLVSGISQIVNKRLSGSGHQSSVHAATILTFNALMAIPFLFYGFAMPTTLRTWIMIVISAVLYTLSYKFYFLTHKHADVSLGIVVRRLSIVFSALLGIVFLKEHIDLSGWFGLVLILLSGIIVTLDGVNIRLTAGVLFALVSAIFTAAAAIFDKQILADVSPFTYVFINPTLAALILVPRKGRIEEMRSLLKSHWKLIIASAVLADLGFALLMYVLQNTDVSRTIPIYKGLSLMITVVLGIFLLKERRNVMQKLLAVAIGILGIYLLS